MKYTILIITPLTAAALEHLNRLPDIEAQVTRPDEAAHHLPDADALILRDEIPVDAALLAGARRLKVVGRVGAGLSGIDVEAATVRGVIVMNTPGVNATSAAEYTFALLLALCRKIIPAHLDVGRGSWTRQVYQGIELAGKTLGLIGLGRVGRRVAERATAFGMDVLAFDPYVAESQVGDLRVKLIGLDELLTRSDIISLHCAVTPETYHLLDADALAQVKPGVLLVNVAHGYVVDEAALVVALKSGRVAGAALDVLQPESPQSSPASSPLVGLPNVIHTPHMGDATAEAQHELSMQIVRQVYDALRGLNYQNAVNMPFMPGQAFEAIRPYLRLAERIGALQHHLAGGRIRRLAVEYKGDELDGLVKPLTVALLKGLLAPALGDAVNYINAPLMAMERGIHVTQAKGLDVADYTNLVSCQVHWEGGNQQVISGALFNRREPRIVQINSYQTDFVPEGILLVIGSYDVPGVIGKVGTIMAGYKINIASWRTGRERKGGQTLSILTLDQALTDTQLEEFRGLEIVRHATQIDLS